MTASEPSVSSRGYDRLARVYHRIEWLAFGGQLQRGRTALIDDLPRWNRLLILGEGDGRLLECLVARRWPDERHSDERHSDDRHTAPRRGAGTITSVDQSMSMLRQQRARVASLGMCEHVEFIRAQACGYEPPAGVYDVMITPFFLDCFTGEELDGCLARWLSGLRPGGILYHVDFIVPEPVWQRRRARSLLWAMHVFFRWQTGLENRKLVDTETAIARCGLHKQAERRSGGGMITTQIWRVPSQRDQVSIRSSGARMGS